MFPFLKTPVKNFRLDYYNFTIISEYLHIPNPPMRVVLIYGYIIVQADIRVSRPEEFHPQPIAEPDVNLSAHPAPIIQPI